jgi:hypothetical protein
LATNSFAVQRFILDQQQRDMVKAPNASLEMTAKFEILTTKFVYVPACVAN